MKCPRCQSSITATPDAEGFLICPGCGARLRSRSAPATVGALTAARAGRRASPLAEGERFPDATNPNATLPPGTPLPRIPRPDPVVRAASHGRKTGSAVRVASHAPRNGKMRPAPVVKEIKTARAQVKQARNYKVRGGDTLYRIALRHGTTVASLLAFNSLAAPAAIKPGDTLKIPAAR